MHFSQWQSPEPDTWYKDKHLQSNYKHKAYRKFLERQQKQEQWNKQAADFFEHHIQWAEDERNKLEKVN